MKVRAHVLISGRVQGVFFRSNIQQKSIERKVTGWVHNLQDGRVEAIFEGEDTDVKELINYCRRGPPTARVENTEVKWEEYTGEYYDFQAV